LPADYITAEVRALIGQQSPWIEACHPVEASEVRRFFQAIMDQHPRYWDEAYASRSRTGGTVAPPAFPVHAFRRPPNALDDPLDNRSDPEFDGTGRFMRQGLPKVPVPLSGILNGGYEYEFFSYARVGERILARSTYRDIYQRQGKSGPMVLVVIEDEYRTSSERPLLRAINTQIMR
jgi:MaoC dehydratase-like protein